MTHAARFTPADGLRYGLLGLPLAFVALPLYVLLPNHYARTYGVPLATLGALLLAARLFDAFTDPWLGRLSDRLQARSDRAVLAYGAAAGAVLLTGFVLLFFPHWLIDTGHSAGLLAFGGAMLALAYLGYSALAIAHQAWGASLGGDAQQRSRIVGWREGFALAGVLTAAVLPTAAGLEAMVAAFALTLGLGLVAWTQAPRPGVRTAQAPGSLRLPFRSRAFRRLLSVFVVNGIASAIPATLVLFFVQDRLQASAALQPAFLGLYFLAAAVSIPGWLRAVDRFGLAGTWLGGMVLSIVVFAFAAALGAGDALPFLVVCALSGIALGTDLVLPGALLAGVVAEHGEPRHAGAFFGWWNFATKLNLALAAGLALPLLALAGYVPGARDPQALWALTAAYCVLPCLLKLAAAGALWRLVIRPSPFPSPRTAT